MPITWTTTGQRALDQGIKVLVHGVSGAGKTTLIKTCPRPIIASAESGTLSIADANIPMTEITSYEDLMDFYNFLISPNAKDFDTGVLDSVSEIAERILTKEKQKAKDPRQAYGEMQDKVVTLLRMFRDIPHKNIYFTCKTAMQPTPEGSVKWCPLMPGKALTGGVAYYFDEFFYLGIGESVDAQGKKLRFRYLQTQPTVQYEAKDRSGALDEIEEPDLTKIFNKIRAKVAPRPV